MFRRLHRRSKRLSQKLKNLTGKKPPQGLTMETLEQRLLLDTAGLWDEVGWRSGSGGGISYDPTGDQADAKMVLSRDGDPIILWVEGESGSLQEYVDTPIPYHWQMEGPIYARQYADGIGWWDLSSGSGDTSAIGTGSQIDAASGTQGQIAVVWVEPASTNTGGDNEIYLRLWNGKSWTELSGSASGGGVSNDTVLNEKPSVAINNLGEIFVSYTAVHPLSNQREIVVKKYGYDYLSPIGPPKPGDLRWIELVNANVGQFGVNATAKTAGISNDKAKSFDSSIIVDHVGKPIVAWASAVSQDNTEIYLKRWDGDSWENLGVESSIDLNGDGNSGVSNNATQSLQPDLAIGPTGDIFVTWVNWTHEGWINYNNHTTNEGAEILVKVYSHSQNPNTGNWQYYAGGSASGEGVENIDDFISSAARMGWYYSPDIEIDSSNQPFIVWQGFGNGERFYYDRNNSDSDGNEYPGMSVYASHGQFNGTSNEFVLLSHDNRGIANAHDSVGNLAWLPAAVVGPNDELIMAYTWHDGDNSHHDDEIFAQQWNANSFDWTEYGRSSNANGNDLWGYFEEYSGYIQLGLLDYDENPTTPADIIVAVPRSATQTTFNNGELYRYSRQTGEWYQDIDLPVYAQTADYVPPYEGSFGWFFDLRGEPEAESGDLTDSNPVISFFDDVTGEPYVYQWNNGGWEFVGEVDAAGRPTAETDLNGNHIAAAGLPAYLPSIFDYYDYYISSPISVQAGPNETFLLAYRTDNLVWPDDTSDEPDIRSEIAVRYWDGSEWIDAGSGYAPVSEPLETLFYSQFDGFDWDNYLEGLTTVAYDTDTGLQTTDYEVGNWYFWHGGRLATNYPISADVSDTAGQFYEPESEGISPEISDNGLEMLFTIDPETENYANLVGQTIKGVFDYQFELNIPADVIIQLAYELDARTYFTDSGDVDFTGEALGELGLYMTIDGEVVLDSGVLVTVNDVCNIDGYGIDQPIASINPGNYDTFLAYDNYTKDSARMTAELGYLATVTTEISHLLTAGEHVLQIWAATVVPQLIYESTFSNAVGGWMFEPDIYEPKVTTATWDDEAGESGADGGLIINFDEALADNDQDNFQGVFSHTLTLDEDTEVSLNLAFEIEASATLAAGDTLDLVVLVDDIPITALGDYQVTSGGGDIAYLDITGLSLGELAEGSHSISIGGILTDGTDVADSTGIIRLDNIVIIGASISSNFNYDSDPRLAGWTGVFGSQVSGGYASDADESDGAVVGGIVTGDDAIPESGGLQIILGDGTGGGNLQGAFDYEFVLAGDTEIEFSYQLTAGAAIPEGETIILMVYIDGQPITSPDGSDDREYILLEVEQASANQDGELEISDSEWQSVTFNLAGSGNDYPGLDTLGPGPHTLRIKATLSQSAEAGEGNTIENTFNSNASPWTTTDDGCTWQSTAGNGGGGGLQIAIGDPDEIESNLEAAWQREFELTNAATVSLDIDYAMTRGAALIANAETLDFYYSIDGGDQIPIASLGGAAGNIAYTSAPQIDLGWLTSGTHTIELVGALTNSGDSGAGETATIKFDNVILTPFVSISDASATVRLDNVTITGGEQTATVRIDNFTLYPRTVSGEGYTFFDDEMDWEFVSDPEDANSAGSYAELGRRLVDDGNLEITLGNGIDIESDVTGYYQKTIYVDNPDNLVIDLWYQLEMGQELDSGETLDLEVWIDDMQLDLSKGFLDGDYLQMVGGSYNEGEEGWHRLVIDTTVSGVLAAPLVVGEHVISIGGRLSDSPHSGGDIADFDFDDWQYTSRTGSNYATDPITHETWFTYDSPYASWQEGIGAGDSDVMQIELGQPDVEESDLEYSWWTFASVPYTSKVVFSVDFEMFTGSDLDGQSLVLYLEVDDQKYDRITIGELNGSDGVWVYARQDVELADWFTAGSHKFELVGYLSGSPIADDPIAIINFDNVTITQVVNPGVVRLDDIYISGTGQGSDAWEFQPAHPDELVGGGNDKVGPDTDPDPLIYEGTYDFQADLHLEVTEPLATDSYIIPHIVTSGRESDMIISFRYRLTGISSFLDSPSKIRVLIDGVPYNENGLPGYLDPLSYAENEHWYDGDNTSPEYTWVTVNAKNIPQGDHVVTIELTAGSEASADNPANLWIDNLTIVGAKESSYTHGEGALATLLATGTGGTRNLAVGVTNITPDLLLYNNDDDIDPDGRILISDDCGEFSNYEGYQTVSIYQYDAASDSWSQYATDFGDYVNIDFSGIDDPADYGIALPSGAIQYRLEDLATGPNQKEWILVQHAAAEYREVEEEYRFVIHPWNNDTYGAGIDYYVQVCRWQPFNDPTTTADDTGWIVDYWQDTGFSSASGDTHSSNGQLVSSGGQFPTVAWSTRSAEKGAWSSSSALRYEGMTGGVNTWGVLGTQSIQGEYYWSAAEIMDMIVGPDDEPIVGYYTIRMECYAIREFIRSTDLPNMTITENSGTANDNLLEYGSTTNDVPYLYQTINISNTGPGPLEIYSIEFEGFGDIANPFTVLVGSQGTPDYPVTLTGTTSGQPGETLSLVVRLDPSDIPAGEYHGVMLVHTSNPTHPTHPYGHYYDMSLQFKILSEAEISIEPTYVEFDDTVINQNWTFNNHSEGWTTTDTANATWNIDAGYSGKSDGGLQIALGDATKIQTNLAYSWEKVFYVTDDSHVTLDLAYAMTRGSNLIDPVTGKALGLYYSIDGGPAVLIDELSGAEANLIYANLVTPLNLGNLTAGEHTLEITATLSASPATKNSTALVKFDNVIINDYTQDEIQEIVIRNSGTDALIIHELAFAGAGFRVLNAIEDGVAGAKVSWLENGILHTTEYSTQILQDITIPAAIDAKLTLKVLFEPDEVTTYRDTLYIHTNDSDEEYISVRFQGKGMSGSNILVTAEGIADPLEPTDSELDFGSVRFGDHSTITLTIQNTGNNNLTIYSVATAVKPDLSIVVEKNGQIINLVSNTVLGRNEFLTVYVTYSPTSADQTGTIVPETLSSTLMIQSDAADSDYQLYLISLVGLGVPQEPAIKILENSGVKENDRNIDFGSVRVGQSYSQTFQIVNIGGDTLRVKYFRIGQSSSQITVSPDNQPNNDDDDIIVAYRGDPVTITATFSPTTAGSIYDQLFVYYLDASGKVVSTNATIQFIGMGIAPGFEVTDENYNLIANNTGTFDFSNVWVGQSSQKKIILRNTGNDTLTINSWTELVGVFTGASNPSGPAGDITLGPGNEYKLTITFTPNAAGNFPQSFVITSDDPSIPTWQFNLLGEGDTPGEIFISDLQDQSLSGINFTDLYGPLIYGQNMATEGFKIKNIGESPLRIKGIFTSSPFRLSSTLSTADDKDDVLLEPGEYYTVYVTFSANNQFDGTKNVTIVTNDGVSDDLTTNIVLTGKTITLSSVGGTNGKRANWFDDDNHLITIILTGDGTATIVPKDLGIPSGDIDYIFLSGTSTKTSLTVICSAGTSIGGVISDTGILKNITFKGNVKLDGVGIQLAALGDKLTIGDLINGADVNIGATYSKGVKIKAGNVGDGSDILVQGNVASLDSVSFGDGLFTADNAGKIKVKTGAVEGKFVIDGNLNSFDSGKSSFLGVISALTIKSIKLGSMNGATVSIGSLLNKLTCLGNMDNSFVLGGYQLGDDYQLGGSGSNADTLVANSYLQTVNIGGRYAGSYVTAGIMGVAPGGAIDFFTAPLELKSGYVGKVSLGGVFDYNAGTLFGVGAASTITSVKDGSENVTLDEAPFGDPWSGDFVAREFGLY